MADDDMPPLEDMEKMVSKIKAVQLEKSSGSYFPEDKEEEIPVEVKPVQVKKNKESFGGMKKGFLFGGSASKSKKVTVKKEDGIDYVVKAKEKKESQLVLEEVQREIRAKEKKIEDEKAKWLKPEILNKVFSNEKLKKYMADPRCMEAIEYMKTNPKEAMVRYQNDTEIRDFLSEFTQLMGDQYSFLSNDTKGAMPEPGEELKYEHLSDDELNEITAQPDVQRFLKAAGTDPKLAQRMYNGASARTRASLQKLIRHGYLTPRLNPSK